jgi:hypothetical protein
LTRQPVQGRANDGGLRIGEMERDGVLAHGMSYFLNESFMKRGESKDYYIAVCNKSGAIAIYNEAKNLFLSPAVDGPIKFNTNPDGTQSIMNISRFGRSFSILKVPYAFKLLIQELQVMNVQMRIITEENVDQLLSMSYSDNINKIEEMIYKGMSEIERKNTIDLNVLKVTENTINELIKTDLEIADEINADSALARKNIKSLLGKGEIAVDNLILVAQESEHPRAYEVLGNFIKTLSDLNKDLLDIQKKKQELKPQDIKQSINVEKAVFVGSTAELLKQIRENR